LLYLRHMAKAIRNATAKVARKAAVKRSAGANLHTRGITPRKITNGPLEWYDVTEQTRYVLNSKLTSYMKLRVAEQRSNNPNANEIARLTSSINEIMHITSNQRSFQSMKAMKSILQKYAGNTTGNIR